MCEVSSFIRGEASKQKHIICFNILMKMDQDSRLRATRSAFYLQAGFGISANTCLLCLNLAAILGDQKPRLIDLPITQLDIPGDVKCKVLVFLHKVMRGLSLGTTCVLNVLQALTISPSGSSLANFKVKSANPILGSCLFLWVLTVAITSNQLLFTIQGHFLLLVTLRDIFFVGLMAVSSGYMATTLLHRHQQCYLSLHGSRLSPQTSPKHRATHSILQLLGCFTALYCADSALSLLISGMRRNDPMLGSIHNAVASSYGTLSPLVLLRVDKQILNIVRAQWRNKAKMLTRRI
ncbi:vomeronasal type-1 receptor 90-like [Marmota flaviventris]|uniref:vomeronasal type-1 receptor 90-like n=1 Tax=Marmota flaviventris TaxID=93162 RepID=UPI003A854C13